MIAGFPFGTLKPTEYDDTVTEATLTRNEAS